MRIESKNAQSAIQKMVDVDRNVDGKRAVGNGEGVNKRKAGQGCLNHRARTTPGEAKALGGKERKIWNFFGKSYIVFNET